MKPQLTLAPWEVALSQDDVRTGPANAVHQLHLEGETRPVLVRFAPDIREQFLMFLKREDDEREGCWTVRDRYRVEAKRFKAPYSPHLRTVRRVVGESLGRVFHHESLDERFHDERLKGVWRVWIGVNGMGSWTNLSLRAPEIVNWQSSSEQQFVFQISSPPSDWKKQSATHWRSALQRISCGVHQVVPRVSKPVVGVLGSGGLQKGPDDLVQMFLGARRFSSQVALELAPQHLDGVEVR